MPLSKTVKNLILAFTVLCGIFLIVFSIEMILLNRDAGDEGADPSLSAEAPDGAGDDAPEPGTDGAEPAGDAGQNGDADTDGDDSQPGGERPAPTGARHEIPVSGDLTLVVYVDGELFEQVFFESEDILGVFKYLGGGSAALQIDAVLMQDGAEEFAKDYLYNDFGVEASVAGREDYIGLSELRGVTITGAEDGTYYEAWVFSLTGPELEGQGLTFVISYENSAQKNALYDILDTLDIMLI